MCILIFLDGYLGISEYEKATLLLYEGKLQHFDKVYLSAFRYCISITTPLLKYFSISFIPWPHY